MARAKETAYMRPYYTGYFGLERTVHWEARDYWGKLVASGRTRRDCERETRARGYKPIRED